MVRLRNRWVPMDPSGWNAEMDLSITVGLGVGNRQEQIGQANEVLQTMAELQRSPFAWLVDAAKVHNALKRKFTAAGIKNVDDFLVDPGATPAPEPQPDPGVQIKGAELQARQQETALKLQLMREEAAERLQHQREEGAAKLQLEREKAAAEIALARDRMNAEIALERERLLLNAQAAQASRESGEVGLDAMHPGGALDA